MEHSDIDKSKTSSVKPKLYYRNKKEDPAQRFQIPSESDQTKAIDRYKPGQLDHMAKY